MRCQGAQIWRKQHCRKKMTHWFHRNPLKGTAPVSFNFYGVATTPAATKICNDLRLSRTQLLELFTDSSCNPEMMKNAADFYFSLLQGFILSLDDSSQECKLRYIQNFKWTDTLQGQVPRCVCFSGCRESHIPKLITPVEKGRDLEARLTESYIVQCQAEAQEVTIARAIELKHNPGLIAALAYETANFYQKADQTLSSLDPAYAGKWRKYLNLKSCFYMAYAYCYHGQTLLASDKCGEAIRSLQESEKWHGIYFQKVPAEAPQLELKANYGLVEPLPFEFPALSAHWTPETVAAFDLTKRPKEDTAKPKPDEEVKPLKEPNIKPQKDSGCQIS
ncbi:hypothetical protein EK904_003874 [Melospiza melodia maxima]|nr:hypothetical protein EK904_003874 [Melospiza melodia maxima]